MENASSDNSLKIAEEFENKGLKIIRNSSNRGFAGGNNDGVKQSCGEIIFLLNPDAVMISENCLNNIARSFDYAKNIGIVGAKLLADDGKTILHCGGKIGLPAHCTNIGRGEIDNGQWNKVMDVDYVTGAALAISRKHWDELGGFDEHFNPAYYEETDLCVRCRKMGKRVIYHPSIELIHHENVSCEYKSPWFWWMHHTHRLWFTVKNYSLTTLLFKAIPAEIKWYFSDQSLGLRIFMLKVYWDTIKKIIKRMILKIK